MQPPFTFLLGLIACIQTLPPLKDRRERLLFEGRRRLWYRLGPTRHGFPLLHVTVNNACPLTNARMHEKFTQLQSLHWQLSFNMLVIVPVIPSIFGDK